MATATGRFSPQVGFKASETLLGIETEEKIWIDNNSSMGFKASETLLGIETAFNQFRHERLRCFKASETLLGIETQSCMEKCAAYLASKPLKPF